MGEEYVLYLLEDQEEQPVAVILPKDAAEQPLPATQEVTILCQKSCPSPFAFTNVVCCLPLLHVVLLTEGMTCMAKELVLMVDFKIAGVIERSIWPGNSGDSPQRQRAPTASARSAGPQPREYPVGLARHCPLLSAAG